MINNQYDKISQLSLCHGKELTSLMFPHSGLECKPSDAPLKSSSHNVRTPPRWVPAKREEPVAIELYDMTGRHVATFYRTDSFDIGYFANGSYIVSVISPRNRYLVKLIKW